MFDLIPFGRNERNLFNYLDNVERSFWDGSISNMAQFRCDVQDKGDSYLLEQSCRDSRRMRSRSA